MSVRTLVCLGLLVLLAVGQGVTGDSDVKKVYVTRYGRSFHEADCRYLGGAGRPNVQRDGRASPKAGRAVPFTSAVKRYRPCQYCKPDGEIRYSVNLASSEELRTP